MSTKKWNPKNQNSTEANKEMLENEYNSISNKDALKDKIHEIHNYLRNNGAGYGMNALKVFNILYGLKKIEEVGLIDKVRLKRPEGEFSYLLSIANGHYNEDLADIIFGPVLDAICASDIKYILFYEIPRNIRAKVFAHLIKEIEKITIIEKTCNVLLSGKIYEYFIGRDESAISELGAYYTVRYIVIYILKNLNPCIGTNGSVPTMIDMFGGSGGFTTGYIDFLKNKYGEAIDWSKEIHKISHFDMNEDVIKSVGLEFLCLTGNLPNMENLQYKNSFTDEFNDRKYFYPLTNPPYGGDKCNKSKSQNKHDKIKDYIKKELLTITDAEVKERRQKQLKRIDAQQKQEKKEMDKTRVCLTACSARIQKFAKNHGLRGNDKESCSLMLLMDIVDVGGTAIGVLKEGVFFNKTYKDLRKCLVENYRVREVISIPQDQFENTSTKTSILIFDNTEEKTEEVIFRDLVVDRYEEDKYAEIEGDIYLVENKGDICGVRDIEVSRATKGEILNNPICSFNGKDYGKEEMVVGEGYELVKLGDICEFLPKSKRNASFGKTEGLYNFYTSSEKVQKCDIADYQEECLIIGSGGVANIKIDNYFSCSADNLLLKTKFNWYVYYILKGNMKLLSDGFTGSTLKHLSKDYLKNLYIPIPKNPEKIKEWTDKISVVYNEKNEKDRKIKELEQIIQNRICEIQENEECEDVELEKLCEFIKTGKNKTPDNKEGTLYPYYGTSNITGYTDYYLFEGKHILVARNGTMGNCFLVKGKIYPSDHIFVIKNNKNVSLVALYYLIKQITNDIINKSNGSTIKGISKDNLSKIKIKYPKNKEIIQDLEPHFQEIENLQQQVEMAEELYKKLIQELAEEAMPTSAPHTEQTINTSSASLIEDVPSTGQAEKIKIKRKKKVLPAPVDEKLT